jgi:hypothetical protein
VFAKAGTNSLFGISLSGSASEYGALTCNLSTGVITKSVGAGGATLVGSSMTALANGWYRISITATLSGSNPIIGIHQANSATPTYGNYGTSTWTAAGTETVNIWGAQLEAGSFATSYLPTVASSVTRSADVASVNTLSPWFNASAGTVYAELERYALIGSSDFANVWALSDGTTSERFQVYNTGAGQVIDAVVSDGGVAQAFLSAPGSITANTTIKTAFSYAVNDFALVRNAGTVQTDTSGTLPTVDRLRIGADAAGTLPWSGYIRRIAYYPRRLTNAELQALTA